MDQLHARLERGIEVTRAAGAMALDYFRRRADLEIEHKGRQDLVSIADRNVEELIRAELGRSFPDDAFLGEEGGGPSDADDGAARIWVIDPIDGTANFLRGIPCWAVTIAYVVDGMVEIGITMDPVHGELFAARRGQGATRDGAPIRVTGLGDPAEATIALTYSFKQPREPYVAMVDRLIGKGCEHRRTGSTAINLCWVADGRFDAMVTLRCNSWDCLGGLLIAHEAGAQATDYVARHGLIEPGGIIATTPGLRGVIEEAAGIGV